MSLNQQDQLLVASYLIYVEIQLKRGHPNSGPTILAMEITPDKVNIFLDVCRALFHEVEVVDYEPERGGDFRAIWSDTLLTRPIVLHIVSRKFIVPSLSTTLLKYLKDPRFTQALDMIKDSENGAFVTFDEPSIGTANHIAVRLIIEGYEVTRARLHTDSSIINSLLEMDKDLERIILFTLRQDGHTMMQAITNCTTII